MVSILHGLSCGSEDRNALLVSRRGHCFGEIWNKTGKWDDKMARRSTSSHAERCGWETGEETSADMKGKNYMARSDKPGKGRTGR